MFSAAWSADRNGIESTRAKIGKYPLIYGITGLLDNGGTANTGVAAAINCSNPTGFAANVQFVVYQWDATLVANKTYLIPKDRTWTVATHATELYTEDATLDTGILNSGLLQIRSDNAGVLCQAQNLDASASRSFVFGLTVRAVNGGG